jgi:hypothetical protein
VAVGGILWRRSWGWRVGLPLIACALGLGGAVIATKASSAPDVTHTVTAGVVRHQASTFTDNVMSFGANPDGSADNTVAFANAIAAAENAGGGTVLVPAGTYAFTQVLNNVLPSSIKIPGPAPVTIMGPPPSSTPCTSPTCDGATLVEAVAGQRLMEVGNQKQPSVATGSMVENLTLNTRSYGGGPDLTVYSTDTTVDDDAVLGAFKTVTIGAAQETPYALSFPGPPNADHTTGLYTSGNIVENTYIEDGVNNDGISFSYQDNSTISNITYFGSRLALYKDSNVTVDNFSYTPNPECTSIAENGFFITAPSSDITITGFTSSAAGGVIGGPAQTGTSTGITISDETMTGGPGPVSLPYHLAVGNVSDLTVSDSNLSGLKFDPTTSVSATLIEDTEMPIVQFQGYNGADPNASVSATFEDDSFPASTFSPPAPTFEQITGPVGPATVTVTGGTWSNSATGFYQGTTGSTFTVTGLAPVDNAPPVISGTPDVGDPLTANNNWQAGQTPAPSFAYQWNADGSPIAGAVSSTYTPVAGNFGQSVTVTVTATNTTGSTVVTSPAVTVKR